PVGLALLQPRRQRAVANKTASRNFIIKNRAHATHTRHAGQVPPLRLIRWGRSVLVARPVSDKFASTKPPLERRSKAPASPTHLTRNGSLFSLTRILSSPALSPLFPNVTLLRQLFSSTGCANDRPRSRLPTLASRRNRLSEKGRTILGRESDPR